MDAINTFIVRRQSAHKRTQEESLKHNKEGHDIQPWSHKATLLTNATRALWGRCEYHNNSNPATINIAAKASSAATPVRQMQIAAFCRPAQESSVVPLTQWRKLSSPSAWPTWAAQALQQRRSQQWQGQQQEESPRAQGQGLQALMPTRWACQSLVWQVLC